MVSTETHGISLAANSGEHFFSANLDQRTGRNDARVRKRSGRAVTIHVHPRYYLYLRRSSGTDVTHHLSSLLP